MRRKIRWLSVVFCGAVLFTCQAQANPKGGMGKGSHGGMSQMSANCPMKGGQMGGMSKGMHGGMGMGQMGANSPMKGGQMSSMGMGQMGMGGQGMAPRAQQNMMMMQNQMRQAPFQQNAMMAATQQNIRNQQAYIKALKQAKTSATMHDHNH